VQIYPRVTKQGYETIHFDDWEHDNPYISQLSAHKAYFRTLITYLRPFIKKRYSLKLLDIGCAIGALVVVAKEQGIDARGIDIAKTAVSYARKLHVPVSQATCESWFRKRYEDYYDVVTALEVIEHDENPLRMMKTIYKMLHAGGILALTTPNFNTVYRILMGNNWIGFRHTEHLWFFTPQTIRQVLQQAGFSDIQVRKDFYRPYSVSYMFRRLGDYIPLLRCMTNMCASLTKRLTIALPFNPWGDMLITAKKR